MATQSEVDLNKKLQLERRLLVGMRAVFADMARDSSSPLFNASQYRSRVATLLNDHYGRVADNFVGTFRTRTLTAMDRLQETMLINEIRDRIQTRSFQQTNRIIATSHRNQRQVIDLLRKAHKRNPDVDPNNPKLRKATFTNLLQRRPATIACTETQWVAETVKFLEFGYMVGDFGTATKARKEKFKRWDTQGDDRVRPGHVFADSQVQDTGDPFEVAGELLRYPGDTELGASVGNIINCRCSAFYSAQLDTLVSVLKTPSGLIQKVFEDGRLLAMFRPRRVTDPSQRVE